MTDWERLVGPFFGEADVAGWLDLAVVDLHARAARELLRLPLAEGTEAVYPTWQFTSSGDVIPHLGSVLSILSTGSSEPWLWALWLCAPDDDLDGLSSWRWLARGRDPAPVLREAARDTARWRT